ncbi:alpha/beta hydrolase [Candidatus Bathyarchaeota archaeon]|nr:alpha/beta hydrolase [Candidatus Bathyarchaeota archaeon]
MVDKITPSDPRIERKTVPVRGQTYSYLLFNPSGPAPPIDTIFLFHGFPDNGLTWRYQVPALLALNLRVVVPDNLGFGHTDSPHEVERYSMKNLSADMVGLAASIVGDDVPFILGGHDWGAGLVWRVALWYPQLVKAVFGVCVPYAPPRENGKSWEELVLAGGLPNFRYQLQLIGPDVEREIQGKEKIRQFLSATYGGRTAEGKAGFTTEHGALLDVLPDIGPPPAVMISEEELGYYVDEFARHGMRGPLNWYRTGRINIDDEAELVERGRDSLRLKMPVLFVAASRDVAVPPAMSASMDKWVENLTRAEVDTSHWAMWEKPEEFNGHVKAWLEKSVLGGGGKASL